MATIIRAADSSHGTSGGVLRFDDLAAQAREHLAKVKAQAAQMIAEAEQQADAIRESAAKEGAQAAVRAVEQMVAERTAPAIAALRDATTEIEQSRQAWLSHWDSNIVRLAVAIAAKVVRREVQLHPEITLAVTHEALELASGSPGVRLHMNPEDYECLGEQIHAVIDSMSSLGGVELVADAAVRRGGCRVETRFGTIDQQFESQLKRIEEELTV